MYIGKRLGILAIAGFGWFFVFQDHNWTTISIIFATIWFGMLLVFFIFPKSFKFGGGRGGGGGGNGGGGNGG